MGQLEIRNWEKYQDMVDGKPADWVKDWCNKDFDPEHMELGLFTLAVLDKCRRLRGRTGKPLSDDVQTLVRQLLVKPEEAKNVANSLRLLLAKGFLVQQNQVLPAAEIEEKRREDKNRIDKRSQGSKVKSAAAPSGQSFEVPS